MRLREFISWAKEQLQFLPLAEKEVMDLCGFFLEKKAYELFLSLEEFLSEEKKEKLIWAIEQRAKRVPFAYLTQEVEFYGCSLFINESVLVPRPETELLVDKIVKEIQRNLIKGVFWDFCSGSGAIGLAIKKKIPSLEVVLADISPQALEIAKINAEKNQLKVQIRESDLFENFAGESCDFFVCNPPYLSENEYLMGEEELFFEPKMSLVAPNNGFYFYQKICNELPFFLKKGGKGFLEIGSGQKQVIQEIFNNSSYVTRVENDWAGHPRFFFLE